MSNHPISLVSPIQIIQASMDQDAKRFSSSTSGPPSSGAATTAASVSTAHNAAATDMNLMQSSDATVFVYGSTASNKSHAANNYTSVDDAAKLAVRVAEDNDVIDQIKRENQQKRKQEQPEGEDKKKSHRGEEPVLEPQYDRDTHYHLQNTMMVVSHGIV